MNPQEQRLRLFLRISGTVCGLALGAVLMPRAWMETIHRALGLGPLPQGPMFEYLARSASALYASLGMLLWLLSGDVQRYRPLIRGYGLLLLFLAPLLLLIDLHVGQPLFWTLLEGPTILLLGLLTLTLQSRLPQRAPP